MHYHRNIRFILFLILPILGFLLGWSLSQKTTEGFFIKNQGGIVEEQKTEEPPGTSLTSIIPGFRNVKPKDVDLSSFWEVWDLLEKTYLHVEDMDTQKQIDGAIKGLVSSLEDPYTTYLTPKEFKEFTESMSGEFEGIGAEIDKRNNQLVIVAPLKGSPAEAAGLKPGDIIFKVNGEPTYDWTIEEAVTKIRGKKGTKVDLLILREGERKPLEIQIVRDNIVLPMLEWEMKGDDNQIALISLYQFGDKSALKFKQAVEEILLKNPKGVIIDLRNNGGGLLDQAIKIISEFLSEKVVVKTKGRHFGDTGELLSERGGSMLSLPLVVLVNEGSASASEIFAGAIQDYRRGAVVGQKTFGKGSVQNLLQLDNGAALKVTIAEWLTPNGRFIHEKGIEPDIVIEPSEEEDPTKKEDKALEKALELLQHPEEMKKILSQPPPKPEEEKSLAGEGEKAEKVEKSK